MMFSIYSYVFPRFKPSSVLCPFKKIFCHPLGMSHSIHGTSLLRKILDPHTSPSLPTRPSEYPLADIC